MNHVDVILTDKTGTITEGKPTVDDIQPNSSSSKDEILSLAAALNANSTHPLGHAIIERAKRKIVKRTLQFPILKMLPGKESREI
jgi:Cu2+-exporting ATPase